MDLNSGPRDAAGADLTPSPERPSDRATPAASIQAERSQDRPFDNRTGPAIPSHVAVEEIEAHLDRLALEIVHSALGEEFLPMYMWLEGQLERKRRLQKTMAAVADRVRRFRDRTAAPS